MANRTDVSKTLAWNQVINNSNSHVNLDYHYGPYDSIDDVPENMRVTGFTCAVMEDGRPAEWWWTGSAWERKGVSSDVYVRYKGVASSLEALEALGGEDGDMYIVPVTGDGGSVEEYREYILAEGRWELLGTRTAGVSGSLSVTGAGDAFTVTDKGVRASSYNGTQNVTLDMSAFAKADHSHDSRYYTESEVDDKLSGVYTKGEVDDKLAGVCTGDEVDDKLSGYYTKEEIDAKAYVPGSVLPDSVDFIVTPKFIVDKLGESTTFSDLLKETIVSSDWFQEAVESAVKAKLYALYLGHMNNVLVMSGDGVQKWSISGGPGYDDLNISRVDMGVSISDGAVTAKEFYEEE